MSVGLGVYYSGISLHRVPEDTETPGDIVTPGDTVTSSLYQNFAITSYNFIVEY